MNEDELVERLRARFARPSADVVHGIGDDAAVLAPSLGKQVLSVDAAIEGVHFRRDWASLPEIGRRSLVAAMSDLAAMGARPRVILVALVLPPGFSASEVDALATGLAAGADECGAPIVGGNLARGAELSITTTVVGISPGAVLVRSAARAGEGVWVTGTLGSAALGLAALEAGRGSDPTFAPFVASWRAPHARLVEGARLLDLATAAIDVSDGAVRDLSRLAKASGVGARIEAALVPLAPGLREGAALLGRDALELALTGGEDYELLFSAPIAASLQGLATRIGTITGGSGVEVVDRDGTRITLRGAGHDHFAR